MWLKRAYAWSAACVTCAFAVGLLTGAVARAQAPALTRIVSYPVAHPGAPASVSGVLRIPSRSAGTTDDKLPAVVLLHGSAGMDSRGALHAADLNRVGIVTLEIDMWGARDLAGGAAGRPKHVAETLPDLAGALAWLARHPAVDPTRLGVMGFSWGGAMAMLAATSSGEAGLRAQAGVVPRALVAFYPVCWGYNRIPGYEFAHLGSARLLVLAGGEDAYDDDPDACPRLLSGLPEADRARAAAIVYPGATHGFNMLEPPVRYSDPYLHRGRGGEAESRPDPAARDAARRAVTDFLVRELLS